MFALDFRNLNTCLLLFNSLMVLFYFAVLYVVSFLLKVSVLFVVYSITTVKNT